MKKTILAISLISIALVACNKPKDKDEGPINSNTTESVTTSAPITEQASTSEALPTGDTPETSLDWHGEYKGVLPCADCEGIKTELELNADKTYELTQEYLGKGNGKEIKTKGRFEFDKTNLSIINLDKAADNQRFFVGENTVYVVEQETGKRIEGPLAEHYTLKKELH